jgi:hypothetical protein
MNIFQLIPHISLNEAAILFLRERGILRSLDHPPHCSILKENSAIQLHNAAQMVLNCLEKHEDEEQGYERDVKGEAPLISR